MTDKELLELAAKAAGIEFNPEYTTDAGIAMQFDDTACWWNPLTDDADSLRLAVKLQLNIINDHVSAGACYCEKDDKYGQVISSGNCEGFVIEEDYVATRRAIVLAAVEIGKSK